MEHYKSLFKENTAMLLGRQQNRANQLLASRSRARKDIFCNGRNISETPNKFGLLAEKSTPAPVTTHKKTPHNSKKAALTLQAEGLPQSEKGENKELKVQSENGENKENDELGVQPLQNDNSTMFTSRIAKVANESVNNKKLTKQEAYLRRFIDWKVQKKELGVKKKEQKRPPFLPSNGNGAINSFAPKNHEFSAPAGLKMPAENKTDTAVSKAKTNRRSLYTVVPTPPRKNTTESMKKHVSAHKIFPISKLALSNAGASTTSNVGTTLNAGATSSNVATALYDVQQPQTMATSLTVSKQTLPKKVLSNAKKSPKNNNNNSADSQKKTQLKQQQQPTIDSNKKPTAPISRVPNEAPTTKTVEKTTTKFLKPCPFIIPPPRKVSTAANKATARVLPVRRDGGGGVTINAPKTNAVSNGGAIGKAKLLQAKRDASQPPQVQKQVKLSVNLKAKQPNSSARAALKSLPAKLKNNEGKALLNVLQNCLPVAETPTDLANNNPFQAFVTSTKLKTTLLTVASNDTENLINIGDTISPVEALELGNEADIRRASAKRTLLLQQQDEVNKEGKTKTTTAAAASDKRKSKFNFVLYAEEDTEIDINVSPAAQTVTTQKNVSPQTPTKEITCEERPLNYMSPFVSVTRGKVSARKEKEKRNSMYLQTVPNEAEQPTAITTDEHKLTIEQRRTLEAVQYFRKQLNDEILRLHGLCDKWEAFKENNMQILEQTGGVDMINASIGQTKLLTSKKFMQFSGLIDRCEQGVNGTVALDDACEATRLILANDLEGFWSMLGMQIDNVDKRFENIGRWKANKWQDPDEVKKPKKNLQKVKKAKAQVAATKAKPSGVLKQMLRQIHADMRKKKADAQAEPNTPNTPAAAAQAEPNAPAAADTTPSKLMGRRRSRSGTPTSKRRRSIIVRDRKYRSVAPTVLNLCDSPRSSSLSRKRSLDSPILTPHIKEMHNNIGHLNSARKSILKTPGTAKGKPKNVVFDQEMPKRKFTFTVDYNDSDDSDKEEMKHKMEDDSKSGEQICGSAKRSYGLRTRKVVLRPSCEIQIPYK